VRKIVIGFAAITLAGAVLAQEPALKFGVFDSAIVFDRSEHGRQLKAEIERLRDLRLKEMTQAQADLNALQQEMRTKELTFNDEKRSEMLQMINQKQIELQRRNDDASREIQAEFNKAQQKLQKELLNVVEVLGRDGQFTFVMEKGLLLYSSPDVDITGLVLDKFNEMYPTKPEEAREAPGP
jgi:Skp family chaperone for outer membrane proteins